MESGERKNVEDSHNNEFNNSSAVAYPIFFVARLSLSLCRPLCQWQRYADTWPEWKIEMIYSRIYERFSYRKSTCQNCFQLLSAFHCSWIGWWMHKNCSALSIIMNMHKSTVPHILALTFQCCASIKLHSPSIFRMNAFASGHVAHMRSH